MKYQIISPIKALILDATKEEISFLKEELTYTNTAVQFMTKRLYQNHWAKRSNPDKWEKDINDLKAKIKQTLVWEDEDGQYYIRPGSIPYLPACEVENCIVYPPFKKVAWQKPLPFKLHDYQEESWQKLLNEKHAHVEICTGAGKTSIILKLCRESGLRVAVVAPSKSIFHGLLDVFETHLGKDKVGAFGDGKKKIDKRFTICIDDSLVNVRPGSKEWEFFSNLDMLIVDESHTWGSETLEELCHGIFANIPYRFFMSATQTRNDGQLKLLQSIIGKCVHTLTTSEAIAGGYICNHDFTIVEIESGNPNMNSPDTLEMKRIHFLNNQNIAAWSAKLANSVGAKGLQTLILVEEMNQIAALLPMLTVPYAVAHSEKKKDRLESLGIEKVDPQESVDKFNRNEVKVLIGTSCISTGTNIFSNHYTINWVGGGSSIRTKQGSVGRSVRLYDHNPHKSKCLPKNICHIIDFDVTDVYIMSMQLQDRIGFYQDSGTPIKRIKLK